MNEELKVGLNLIDGKGLGLIDEKVDVEISKNEKWYEKGITLNVTIGLIVVAVVGYFVYTKYVKK